MGRRGKTSLVLRKILFRIGDQTVNIELDDQEGIRNKEFVMCEIRRLRKRENANGAPDEVDITETQRQKPTGRIARIASKKSEDEREKPPCLEDIPIEVISTESPFTNKSFDIVDYNADWSRLWQGPSAETFL